MNYDIEYQAWVLLDEVAPHPEIEERKRRIVDRSLERIEEATCAKEADEMAEILRLEERYGNLLPWLPN